MKKSLFTLAAAAVVLASCSSDDILVEEKVQNNTPETAIGFSTFAQKATRAENSEQAYSLELKDHHTNFAVWGYKNTEADKVFNNQLVSWSSTDSKWGYTPVRFWDKAATTYEFYAAAPQTDENGVTVGWTFNGDDTEADNAHYFSLAGATLVGSNLSNTATTPTTTYVTSFISAPKVSGTQDIDYMIADKKSVGKAAFTASAVELDFIHILSRLNVTIKKASTMPADAVVTLKSLEVVNLNSKGDFDESKVAADKTKRVGRWDNQSTAYTLNAITDYTVTASAAYVLQSLVIPQETEVEKVALDGSDADSSVKIATTSKPYIKIVYTIDPDGNGSVPAEKYTAYYNLATVFGVTGTNKLAFNEGWQNILNITIDPVQINFTGKTCAWDDDLNKDLDVK